jgi:hypothetical protein
LGTRGAPCAASEQAAEHPETEKARPTGHERGPSRAVRIVVVIYLRFLPRMSTQLLWRMSSALCGVPPKRSSAPVCGLGVARLRLYARPRRSVAFMTRARRQHRHTRIAGEHARDVRPQ